MEKYSMIKEAQMYPSPARSNFFPIRKKGMSRTVLYVVAAVLTFGVFLTFINIYELRRMQQDHGYLHSEPEARGEPHSTSENKLTLWIHGKRIANHHLSNVVTVFENVGYNVEKNQPSDWDVLWTHDYPFIELKQQLSQLKPNQRVNHFPGSGFITNKVGLATSKEIKHIPKAFKIPKDKAAFLAFANEHPDLMWVQKSSNHRGVHIKKVQDLELDKQNSFIQQYVDKPYLIDGKRFDIGIYTTLTSIDPLRVYINEGDFLVRFCSKDYYPFNPDDRDKYVVHDDYLPMWKIPTMKKYYEDLGYTFKESLLAHLRDEGHDSEVFMEKLRECIRSVYLAKEKDMIKASKNFKTNRHFFEMVRFDFVFDQDLNVYLMEVNMSPNLSSTHFPPNKLLYLQTIFSMLSLVGVARVAQNDLTAGQNDSFQMQVYKKDIVTYSNICGSKQCHDNCLKQECKLCSECLTVQQEVTLQQAYLEHMNRNRWRRILPKPFKDQTEARSWSAPTDGLYRNLTTRNKWLALWFHGKCLQDAAWCY